MSTLSLVLVAWVALAFVLGPIFLLWIDELPTFEGRREPASNQNPNGERVLA